MKPLRMRLLENRNHLKLPWEVLERDYLLSWVLAGISQVKILQDTLIFKGGTALKKCYFGNYRFSEDLDFTGLSTTPQGEALLTAMQEACIHATRLLNNYAPVEISCHRYQERQPHPRGQEAFDIRARFPWHRQPQTTIMVEVTTDEKLMMPSIILPIIHEYGEKIETKLSVYSLEEIIAEKLRAILQNIQAFERKGWVRSRARDYYDLWRILSTYREKLDLSNFQALLRQKCDYREVNFSSAASFFIPKLLTEVEKTWDQWLGPLLPHLPSYEQVINELRLEVDTLFHDIKIKSEMKI